MNMRLLYGLLVVWGILLIAPGAIVVAIVGMDANTSITGGVILAWILGYLGQFAVFMWIMNIVKEQKVLWWFAASLLPWAVDWTLPVSPLYILLWIPVLGAIGGWIALVARRAESLRLHGIRARGVVLEVLKPFMNVVINRVYIKRKVRLRIEREDGVPPYQGVLNGLFMLGEIPSPGDSIPLLVDAAQPQRFEYDQKGTTRAAPARSAAREATVRESFVGDLHRLASLHDRGALTDSEFDAAKKKLLASNPEA